MHLKDYRNDLLKRLKDPEYAAAYLAQVLGDGDSSAFLLALKDVVEASGGVGSLAGHVDVQRPSLYRILSKKGNPTLNTLKDILKPLGLQVSVTVTPKRSVKRATSSRNLTRSASVRQMGFRLQPELVSCRSETRRNRTGGAGAD